jgi:hypothetical protein
VAGLVNTITNRRVILNREGTIIFNQMRDDKLFRFFYVASSRVWILRYTGSLFGGGGGGRNRTEFLFAHLERACSKSIHIGLLPHLGINPKVLEYD